MNNNQGKEDLAVLSVNAQNFHNEIFRKLFHDKRTKKRRHKYFHIRIYINEKE